MTTTQATSTQITSAVTPAAGARLVRGIIGGIAGGMMFGAMMQMMDAIPMIASLVGSDSIAVGWLVHLAISGALGVGFALVAGTRLTSWAISLGLGLAYGMVWWVLGALIAMPAALGMPVFTLDAMAWQSLMGHMIYGAILGVVAFLLGRRAA